MNERERIRRKIFDKPKEVSQEPHQEVSNAEVSSEVNPELLKMFPLEKIERIKKRELRKYERAQEKKWRNYLESVSK